jgi:hypothetical protein
MGFRLLLYTVIFGLLAPLAGLAGSRLWPRGTSAPITQPRHLLFDALALVAVLAALFIIVIDIPHVDGELLWFQTLNPHFGPALRVLQGGVPMIDVFCQYGLLPYLLFSLAFLTVFAPSYPAVALVTSLVTAGYIAVAGMIAFRATASRMIAVSAVVVLALLVVPIWNHIPASGAFRFLPPLLICLGLIVWNDRLWPAVVFLVIASFWSLEALAWSMAVFFGTVGARLIYDRAPLNRWIADVGAAGAALVIAHAAFAITWKILFASWPRYDIYLEMVTAYGKGAHQWNEVEATYAAPMLAWLAIGAIYVLGIALGFAEALRGKLRGRDPALVLVVLPLAVAGGVSLSYWVGRPVYPNLMSASVPAVILGAILLDRLLVGRRAMVAGALVSLLCMVAWPYPPFPDLLRGGMARVQRAMTISTDPQAYDPIITEAAELIRKHQRSGGPVVLFARLPRSTAIYLLSDTRDAFGRSTDNMELSPTFMTKALQHKIEPGSLIFLETVLLDSMAGRWTAPTPTVDFTSLDQGAFAALIGTYDLCIIDRGDHGMIVAQVSPKSSECDLLH